MVRVVRSLADLQGTFEDWRGASFSFHIRRWIPPRLTSAEATSGWSGPKTTSLISRPRWRLARGLVQLPHLQLDDAKVNQR